MAADNPQPAQRHPVVRSAIDSNRGRQQAFRRPAHLARKNRRRREASPVYRACAEPSESHIGAHCWAHAGDVEKNENEPVATRAGAVSSQVLRRLRRELLGGDDDRAARRRRGIGGVRPKRALVRVFPHRRCRRGPGLEHCTRRPHLGSTWSECVISCRLSSGLDDFDAPAAGVPRRERKGASR